MDGWCEVVCRIEAVVEWSGSGCNGCSCRCGGMV